MAVTGFGWQPMTLLRKITVGAQNLISEQYYRLTFGAGIPDAEAEQPFPDNGGHPR